MTTRRRKALLFAAVFLPALAVLLALYPFVLPPYERAVIAVANPLLKTFEPRFEIAVDDDGTWIASEVLPGGARERAYGVERQKRHLLYLGLVLLPALLLATPAAPRRRLILAGWGLLALAPLHVVAEIALVRVNHCIDLDPGGFFCRWLHEQLAIAGQLGAVLLWAVLSWRFWLPPDGRVRRPAASPGTSRNAPCPCGSGRKRKRCCGA